MTLLASQQQKNLPPVGLDLMITGSRDYCWFKSPMLNQLSQLCIDWEKLEWKIY